MTAPPTIPTADPGPVVRAQIVPPRPEVWTFIYTVERDGGVVYRVGPLTFTKEEASALDRLIMDRSGIVFAELVRIPPETAP